VTQSGAHQAQPFVNLPTATPAAAYAGYGAGLYYNAFQYPPTMFAAAATAVSIEIEFVFQQRYEDCDDNNEFLIFKNLKSFQKIYVRIICSLLAVNKK